MKITPIAPKLLVWFDQFGRKNFPWQANPANPYHVWLSEIMLQQTQATTVKSYFKRFIQALPTIETLATADEDQVLALWAGLGYYARARNLHRAAKIIIGQYHGSFPREFTKVLALPGVGESTAGAILSISFNQNHAILDGNVKRVLCRYHTIKGHYGQSAVSKTLWQLARQHTPLKRCADYTQAIMDLGATICTRTRPNCDACPIQTNCQADKQHTQDRYPTPKPMKNKPSRTTAMLIFTNRKNEVYLQKRPAQGIWGGLWSFLECADNPQIIAQTIKQFNPNTQVEKCLPPIKHSFTHYHLHINPIIIRCFGKTTGFRLLSDIDIGLPAPVNKIIAQLD